MSALEIDLVTAALLVVLALVLMSRKQRHFDIDGAWLIKALRRGGGR